MVIALAAVLALGLGLFKASRPGYLLVFTRYDDGVYFGNAVRLVHGAIAYRNFAISASAAIAADRFTATSPGCPQLVDSVGTLIATTGGKDFTGSPAVLAADTGAWQQAFSRAQYYAAEATPRAAGCLYGRKEKQRNMRLGCLENSRTLPAEPSPGGTRCRGRAKYERHDHAGHKLTAGA
jgi:hypothetical protein